MRRGCAPEEAGAFVPGYLEQIPFTGMISACGATIEKDGQRLYNKEMPVEVAKLSWRLCVNTV